MHGRCECRASYHEKNIMFIDSDVSTCCAAHFLALDTEKFRDASTMRRIDNRPMTLISAYLRGDAISNIRVRTSVRPLTGRETLFNNIREKPRLSRALARKSSRTINARLCFLLHSHIIK